ncbi:MAG TPA: filamentous hemagglutinin N-terminal domain-containing protein, partial [Allocoleopsis sp.]
YEVKHLNKPLYFYRNSHINISDKAIFNHGQKTGLSSRIKLGLAMVSQFPFNSPLKLVLKKPQPFLNQGKWANNFQKIISLLALSTTIGLTPAQAQNITPNNDGTNTIVNPQNNQFNITGGTVSGDGSNLFHSFSQFNLNQNEIANFLSNPDIRNILGRINGGDPSIINGLIQVSGGNSNLFLMNPAGIIFGQNASLNVPGDFTATTATSIGFNNGYFNAFGNNNYASLIGNPNSFIFGSNGVITNNGNLSLAEGKTLSLFGDTVINTGTISTPSGSVSIASIPRGNAFKITQTGYILSLEIPAPLTPFTAKSLPQLLTGGNLNDATGLSVNSNGQVVLSSSGLVIPTDSGTSIISGNVNTSNLQSGKNGGNINLIGQNIALVDNGQILASG